MDDDQDKQRKEICLQLINVNHIRKIKPTELLINNSRSNVVGSGGQATVRKGLLDGKYDVAVKILNDIDFKLLAHELVIVSNLKHSNIPVFHGVLIGDSIIELVFDFINGKPLNEYDFGTISDKSKIKFVKDIANAIQCVYKNNFVHRDLKPENIMIDEKNEKAYLIDFGIAKVCNNKLSSKTRAKGTIYYIPPETFADDESDENGNILVSVSHKTDVWSFGCIISYLFSGYLPWTNKYKDKETTITKCIATKKDFPIPDNNTDPTIRKIIEASTILDPKKRADINDIVKMLESL